jgi:hypothetical protein
LSIEFFEPAAGKANENGMNPKPASLCDTCRHLRVVTSGKGSQFLLCQLSHADKRYPKYPPQPVAACQGYQPNAAAERP